MNKNMNRGQIYFNGFLKYYKKKKLQRIDKEACCIHTTHMGHLKSRKEKNGLHVMENEEESSNYTHAEDAYKVSEEGVEDGENVHANDGARQWLSGEKKCGDMLNGVKEKFVEKSLSTVKLNKSFPPKKGKRNCGPNENVNGFPKYGNKDVSLNDAYNDVLQSCSPILNKKTKAGSLLTANKCAKKKCSQMQNKLHKKKMGLLNKNCDFATYFSMNHRYNTIEPYNKSYYGRRNKNKIQGEKCIYKYELPTIASLGKVKKLDYLNVTINDSELNGKTRMMLHNLSHVYFDSCVLHNITHPCKKKKSKKKKKMRISHT
ncbi:conserved Plasmodium protein, unknown function [Plasmodium ovale]|uniref:Uncharacterized protein n=1 Tax=Plasmodium ovale TaxID=36330 RepID=A0A1D3U9W2_PLAOA|nr:conserved Plasmodium protein, unknown function [Plasmodium ovale]